MNKTKVLKNLLACIIIVLTCVILSVPTILKMNSEIAEYKDKTQSLEQEIIQLKRKISSEQNNKSSIDNSVKQNNKVEENSAAKNDTEDTNKTKTDTTENNATDNVVKTETKTSTYQQNNYSNKETGDNNEHIEQG